MSTDLLVIVDDTYDYGWYSTELLQWYNATSSFLGISFTFNGTYAAFIGISHGPIAHTVQINGSYGILNWQISDPDPQTYKQCLPSGNVGVVNHTITFIGTSYPASVDYAVVKVGLQTSLTGQTVIVDDDSSLIQYSGQWSRTTTKFTPGSSRLISTGYPYGNSTHRSPNPGDTFTFRFSGTSIAIYGIFSWNEVGTLSMTCSIDGTPHSASFSVNTSSPNYLNHTGEVSNHLYFSLDNLRPGPHTLLVNITEAKNHTFILDYITYRPAFDTLSSMPSLSPDNSSTSSTSSASGSQKSVATGALVGGVLGGIAFGVLVTILVLLLIRRRRRAREQHYAHPDAALRNGSDLNDPNILNPYTANSFQMQEHQSPLRPQPFHH